MTLVAEKLESREVLAGNVLANVFGEMLVLWGDAAANSVSLTYNSANQHYQVIGHDSGGAPTTVNGLDTSQPANLVDFSGVKSVAVLLNGGDDTFQVGSPAAVDTVISKWMAIDMGDGDDHVALGQAGKPPGGADPVATSLETGTSLTVALGKGDDELENDEGPPQPAT